MPGLFCYFDKRPGIKQFTLNKKERVKKQKDIDALFKEGKTFAFYPLRAYYLLEKGVAEEALQFGCGASKKNFKKAVDRNRIKRLIREAYRVKKNGLKEELIKREMNLKLFIIYTGKELPDFKLIQEKTDEVLNKLEKEITNFN